MKKLLVTLLCLFSATVGRPLTLSQIRTELRRAMRDNPTDTARQEYSDATLLDYINEGQRDIVNATWLLERTTGYVLQQKTTYYNLPTETLAVNKVLFTNVRGQTIVLEAFTKDKLYDNLPTWDQTSGNSPVDYWISETTFSSTANPTTQRISYFPVPANAQSTGTVTLWYFYQATDLSGDSDVPFEGRRTFYTYHMAIVYHAAMRLKLIEGDADGAKDYATLYQNYIALIKNRIGQLPDYNPGMTVGTPTRH